MDDVKSARWYFQPACLFVGFLCVGPLITPLAWLNPGYTLKKKIIITFVIIIASFAVWAVFRASFKSISAYYELLEELIKG